jgi:thiamine monophosphate synthase
LIGGLKLIRAVKKRTNLPILGIGGITPENAQEVLEAGATGVVVISGILGADNPKNATYRYRQILTQVRSKDS